MTYAVILAFIDAEIKFWTLHCKSENRGNVKSVNPNQVQSRGRSLWPVSIRVQGTGLISAVDLNSCLFSCTAEGQFQSEYLLCHPAPRNGWADPGAPHLVTLVSQTHFRPALSQMNYH